MNHVDQGAIDEINNVLININPESLSSNPQECYRIAIWCASQRAFTGSQMAIAKKEWQDAKAKAYQTFTLSNEANQTRVEKYGVMVVKDYINAKCGDYEARYELIERTNAALDSMIRTLATIISSLKEENKNLQFARS